MKTERKSVRDVLTELRLALDGIYGTRLKGLYLYGSYARDEQDEESDLDILVVLDRFDSYAGEVDRTGQFASDLSLKYGITVSQVFIRQAEWLHGVTPFLRNVRDEAVPF